MQRVQMCADIYRICHSIWNSMSQLTKTVNGQNVILPKKNATKEKPQVETDIC